MENQSVEVEAAKRRLCEYRQCENDVYKEFLHDYGQAENGKRAESRNQRGCLTKDWKPENLSKKSILVVAENGIGDEVLTISCLLDLAMVCKQVIWFGDPKLKTLFSRSFSGVQFVSKSCPRPIGDGTIYSWELIRRFRSSLDEFGWTKNGRFNTYLRPPAHLKEQMRARYADGLKKLVGLAWKSERDQKSLADKTCDLRDVRAWAKFFEGLRDKVRFISIQYGDTDDELAFARWRYGAEIYQDKSVDIYNDVDAAAAQISAMDYVVSISTTAAHMAGALGVPGRILLQEKPYGHWRAGQEICPWYPTLRPVRQPAAGDWKSVLSSVAEKLVTEFDGINVARSVTR